MPHVDNFLDIRMLSLSFAFYIDQQNDYKLLLVNWNTSQLWISELEFEIDLTEAFLGGFYSRRGELCWTQLVN